MMEAINGVDFTKVLDDAVNAAKEVVTNNWEQIQDVVEDIGKGLANDASFIAKKKLSGEFSVDDAKAFMDGQAMTARISLRSIAIITLQLAEKIWNAIVGIFRSAISKAIGWDIL